MRHLYRSLNAPCRRYLLRIGAAQIAYAMLLAGVAWLFQHHSPEGPIKYAIAILPALPIMGIIASMALYLIEETDEYIRMRQGKAMLIGLGVTLSLAAAWGFLELFSKALPMATFCYIPDFFALWGILSCGMAWGDQRPANPSECAGRERC